MSLALHPLTVFFSNFGHRFVIYMPPKGVGVETCVRVLNEFPDFGWSSISAWKDCNVAMTDPVKRNSSDNDTKGCFRIGRYLNRTAKRVIPRPPGTGKSMVIADMRANHVMFMILFTRGPTAAAARAAVLSEDAGRLLVYKASMTAPSTLAIRVHAQANLTRLNPRACCVIQTRNWCSHPFNPPPLRQIHSPTTHAMGHPTQSALS